MSQLTANPASITRSRRLCSCHFDFVGSHGFIICMIVGNGVEATFGGNSALLSFLSIIFSEHVKEEQVVEDMRKN